MVAYPSNMSTTPEYLVISSSLRKNSYSRIMGEALRDAWAGMGAEAQLVDLREYELPFCDAETAYGHKHVPVLASLIAAARVVTVATPIYNYGANSVVKNLVELTGRSWENKVVGFLCAAGGATSYMSIMGLANSLMLDFRCLIIPRFVYAVSSDFTDGKVSSEKVAERIEGLAKASIGIRNA
jgi:FMN reductase